MTSKSVAATASFIALVLSVGQSAAADRIGGALTCADLQWSAEVLAANPDISLACRGVFEKDGVLFAKATIEVVKVQGDTMKFRTLRTDGTKGATRSVELDSHWRVKLDGREYRARDLNSGQQLNIYLPQDRFALTVAGSNGGDGQSIKQAESP